MPPNRFPNRRQPDDDRLLPKLVNLPDPAFVYLKNAAGQLEVIPFRLWDETVKARLESQGYTVITAVEWAETVKRVQGGQP